MTERGITAEQWTYLLNPLRTSRISTRNVSGKNLSYLAAWDVKAHLTRIFGFGNWDSEVLDYDQRGMREYESSSTPPKPMVEPIWSARVQLTIRDQWGGQLCRHSESAVGSASGPDYMLADLHDNALKTAASDALKRCAINLGTQFGLSLYDDGNRNDIIKTTLVKPDGVSTVETPTDPEAQARVAESLGATEVQ